jgi:hypothetical protein
MGDYLVDAAAAHRMAVETGPGQRAVLCSAVLTLGRTIAIAAGAFKESTLATGIDVRRPHLWSHAQKWPAKVSISPKGNGTRIE